jgi:hypothetical protein
MTLGKNLQDFTLQREMLRFNMFRSKTGGDANRAETYVLVVLEIKTIDMKRF